MDYYLSTHMPLAQKLWSSHGLTGWKVVKLPEDQPFSVHAILEWVDEESTQKALGGEDTKTIMDDVPNFTDSKPTIIFGPVVGSS